MSSIMLKVTPNELKTKANQISGEIKDFESYWKRIENIISSSKGYWVGEASNAHQKQLKDVSPDMIEIIKRLKEHPTDLLSMAGIYQEAETQAEALAAALPADVII